MNVIITLDQAATYLDKCESDFEAFYKAAMYCYGMYYFTLALIEHGAPTIECVKEHEKAKELIKKFNEAYV